MKEVSRHIQNLQYNPLIKTAINFACLKHQGQKRKYGGEDYIIHPIRVANLVMKYTNLDSTSDNPLIKSSLFHDLLEDTDATLAEIIDRFGYEVAYLVNELTSNKKMQREMGKTVYMSYKFEELSSNALLIKLCDRLDNINDLQHAPLSFIKKYTNETTYVLDYLQQHRTLTNTQQHIVYDINQKIDHSYKKLLSP